jgi:hypothetical protein
MFPEGFECEASRESMLLDGGFFTFLWQSSFTKGEKPLKIWLLGVAISFGIFVLSQLLLAIPVMAESTNIYAAPGCISFLFEDLFQEAIS